MPISGKDLRKELEKAGWVFIRQKGSHAIMGKGTKRVPVPMHRELKKGTEHAIRKATKE